MAVRAIIIRSDTTAETKVNPLVAFLPPPPPRLFDLIKGQNISEEENSQSKLFDIIVVKKVGPSDPPSNILLLESRVA